MRAHTFEDFVMMMFAFVVGITFHEWGHAWMATRMGDDTPRRDHRVTLNPLDHLDPFGTAFIAVMCWFGVGFGWGRPVMTQPANYRSPRWGMFWVAAAGPIMSFTVTAVAAMLARFNVLHLPFDSPLNALLLRCVDINCILFLFNLIPVPPLDGSKMLSALLPTEMAIKYDRMMSTVGFLFFILLISGGGVLLRKPIIMLALGLLGPDYTYDSN